MICLRIFDRFFSIFNRAAASILHPLGYTSDPVLGQVRVRGGALLLANYLLVMAGLGAGLALSLLHRVPNTYQGLEMASIGVQVDAPQIIQWKTSKC